MKILVKDPHLFTVEEVIIEYEMRNADKSTIINDTDEAKLPPSVRLVFKYYYEYKKYDLALSHLTIEGLVIPVLRDNIFK